MSEERKDYETSIGKLFEAIIKEFMEWLEVMNQ
jgi:hypothetical protein